MTLAFYGKSRRRQGGLALAALLAVLLALAGAIVLQGRSAEAATTTLAPSTASCSNDNNTDDDFGANTGVPCSGNAATLAADDSTWFNVETDDRGIVSGGDLGQGDDDLSVTFAIPSDAGSATNIQLKVWAAASDAPGQLKAGSADSGGNDDKYGSLALGSPATYIHGDLTSAVKSAAGGNLTVNLSMNCSPDSDDCGALVNKVELMFDVLTQDDYEAQLHTGDPNPQLTQTDLCGAANFQFVLDRSGSMDDDEAALEGAVNTFVNGWETDFPSAAKYGGVFFGDGSASTIAGGGYTTAGAFTTAVSANGTYNGFTPTALGITTATGNTGNRLANVPDIMFIITDGSPNQPSGGLDLSDPVRWVNAANAAIDAANTARADNAGEVTSTANRYLVFAVFVGEGDESGPFGDMNAWAAAVMTQIGGGSYVSSSFDALPTTLRQLLNCEEPKGTIEIHKDDSQAGDQGTPNPVAGATFKLEGPDSAVLCVTDDGDGNTDTTIDSDAATACAAATAVDDENATGGTTVVGGLAVGNWTVTEVGVPAGYGPDVCGNVRAVQVSGGNTAVISGPGCTAGSPGTTAFHNPLLPREFTITAEKVVCESESYLPNWAGRPDNNPVSSAEVHTYVTSVNTNAGKTVCSFVEWTFEVASTDGEQSPLPADDVLHDARFVPFAGTSSPIPATGQYRIREQFVPGYIDFTGQNNDSSNPSAEFYCNDDVQYFDNMEWVGPGDSYCVAFNAPDKGDIIVHKVYEKPAGYTPDGDDEPDVDLNGSDMTDTGANIWQESVDAYTGHTVTETPAPGWEFVSVEVGPGCGLAAADLIIQGIVLTDDPEVVVGVEPGGACEITYTNRMRGAVEVEKVDLSTNGNVWDFSIDGPGAYTQTPQLVGSNTIGYGSAPYGAYTVTETTAGVYSSITQCPSPNPNGTGIYVSVSNPTGNVIDEPGETITFIFTNQDCPVVAAAGNLRIFKWNDENGNGLWDITEDPIANWKVTISGPEYPGGVDRFTNAVGRIDENGITAGFYTVTEEQQSGWSVTGLIVNGANQAPSTTAVIEVKDLTANPDATVEFGNREPAQIIVIKTVDDQVGNRGVGGWHINVAGCGTSINKVTDGAGQAVFSNLAPADNCAYTVTETDSEGFSVSYTPGQVVTPGPGEPATVNVKNTRVPGATPPPPAPTNTPTATATPETPAATPTDTEEPEPTETVAGERTPGPGVISTPIPPDTGSGVAGGGASGSITLAALSLLAVTAGTLFVNFGRKRA